MKKSLLVSILVVLIGGFFASSVVADDNHHRKHDDTLVKFKGGIGVVPVSNVARGRDHGRCCDHPKHGPRGQSPGQIWRIKDLEAKMKENGDIKVEGKGLVLAGGNNIGTNDGTECVCHSLFVVTTTVTSTVRPYRCAACGQRRLQNRRGY